MVGVSPANVQVALSHTVLRSAREVGRWLTTISKARLSQDPDKGACSARGDRALPLVWVGAGQRFMGMLLFEAQIRC